MKHTGYSYDIKAKIVFTWGDLVLLRRLSQHHYDGKCKGISRPGEGSFLWGWMVNCCDWESDKIPDPDHLLTRQ